MAEKRFVDVKTLKVGNYVLIQGEPCKIVKITSSAPGKHGAAKYRIEAIGVFDGQKRSLLRPSGTDVEVPIIEKKNGQVLAILGENVQIMDLNTYETFELPIPEDLREKMEPGREVEFLEWGNRRKLVRVRGE